jgi:broad specificity phosphatase PhoE
MSVFAIRHGETEWSLNGRHTGTTDIPLTDKGWRRAGLLGPALSGRAFALVLVSPLQRVRETCEPAGVGARAIIEPDLAEWNYGKYERLTPAQIHEQAPGWLSLPAWMPGRRDARASRGANRSGDRPGARRRGRRRAVRARTRAARARGALARVARGRRAAFPAGYGHGERARPLPRCPRREDLECAARRLRVADRSTRTGGGGPTEPGVIWMAAKPSRVRRTTL